jgi:hypothetical protein
MLVRNVKYYSDLEFADYLAMPGVSYSSIKGFDGPANVGMSLGTNVHQYILEPAHYPWENVAIVKPIAAALRQFLDDALIHLQKEIAFTADFHYNGLIMPYKGRADLLKVGKIVVDLKVLSGALAPAIARFGYDKQLSGYCLATSSPMGLILAYNRVRKVVEHAIIKPSEEYWNYQIVQRCQIPV